MPIHIATLECKHPIVLSEWTTADFDAMAGIITQILLGRIHHVRRLVDGGTGTALQTYRNRNIDEAISRVNFPGAANDDPKIIHRDGWLFQFVSWIACVKETPDALVRAPQPRPADKGFDGLLFTFDGHAIESIVICEDKATDNPRSTILDDVWPEFSKHEEGERDNELTSELLSLLGSRTEIDVNELTRSSDWLESKRYRASVATSRNKLTPRVHTFEGYDSVVDGGAERRSANFYLHEDMREFFRNLSLHVVTKLEALRPANDV